MMVIPTWCYGKDDGCASLVDRWLGEDAEFAAKSIKNRANRGTAGTHGQGNRNHWGYKAIQEGKLKKPLSDMVSWKLARARSKWKDGESEYYGNTEKNLESYLESFTRLNPGSDVVDPILSQTDEMAVVAIQPKYHVRYPCLDGVITPSVSYTWLRATNPSPSGSTGRSHPSLASQHAAYKAFVELKHVEVREYLQRVKANEDYNRLMMAAMWSSMQNRTDPPPMGPAPPPSGEPPHVPTFDEWVALGSGTPGTGGSFRGSTPGSESPVTPVCLGGAGLGGAGGDDPNLR